LFQQSNNCEVLYKLASADDLKHLADASVDYIFTDPPFGSNIYYSDMSLFHEAWLGSVTNSESEAVVHTTAGRKKDSLKRYEDLLRQAFAEGFRVLKPGAHMSVVFGNSSGRIWGLVQRAIRDAGFRGAPVHVAILDKGQRSVKGLNSGSESVVTVDLIMTVAKRADSQIMEDARPLSPGDVESLIQEAIAELSIDDARNPSHVYARLLSRAVHRHLMLDHLHLADVLVALRKAGYSIDRKSGLLRRDQPVEAA
jgi:adenine-specific DNA methylase